MIRLVNVALLFVLLSLPGRAFALMSVGGILAFSPSDIAGFASMSDDNKVVKVDLGFTFTVEGVDYTTVAISTNGWIEFGDTTTGDSDQSPDPLPTSNHQNPFIAAYWTDLLPFGTGVRYHTVGTAPNRVFVADYEADQVNGVEGADDVRFQIQLHEGSNLITVRYRDLQSHSTGEGATIGFQGAGGANATAYPLVSKGKILDYKTRSQGWSADVGRAGDVRLAAQMHANRDESISNVTTISTVDTVKDVDLGFSVTIAGSEYRTVAISTNGWLEFGGNSVAGNGADHDHVTLPTDKHLNPFLAAYWDSLLPFDKGVRYWTVGDPGNRTFIVDYQVDSVNGLEGTDDIYFQVQIHETSSLINVDYISAQPDANGQHATIGFQTGAGDSTVAYPITCNGKVLDDNAVDNNNANGWSIDARNEHASLSAIMAASRDDIPGSFVVINGDEVTDPVSWQALGFGVNIDGDVYDSVVISSNGWLEFGKNTAVDPDPSNAALPTSKHMNPFLAAYWDDLLPFGAFVRYGMVGKAPNRTFIVDYEADSVLGIEGSDDIVFQVQIHETSSLINVLYMSCCQRDANGQKATIGFQSKEGIVPAAYPITFNGEVLDDARQEAGWSVSPIDTATTSTTTLPTATTSTTIANTTSTTTPGATSTTSTTITSVSTTISTTPTTVVTTSTIVTQPTTTTLPPLECDTARACLEQLAGRTLCQEAINPKLQKLIEKKRSSALTALMKATFSTGKKAARLTAKARKSLLVIDKQAGLYVSKKKGPITTDCRDRIEQAYGVPLQRVDANRI